MKGPALVQDVTVNLSILVTGTEEEFDNTGLAEFREAVEDKVRRILNDAGFNTGVNIWAQRGPGGSRFYSPAEVVDEEGGFAAIMAVSYVMGGAVDNDKGCNHIWQSGASNDWIFDECAICGTHRGKEG